MASGAGEKTEKPTEKRLRDARRRGQVSKSQDLTSALLLITTTIILAVAGPGIARNLATNMRDSITRAATFNGTLEPQTALSILISAIYSMAAALLPLLVGLAFVAALVSYLQVGPVFAFDPLKPTLNKLNPVEGFKQKFLKPRTYLELCKTILKIIIVGVVTYLALWNGRGDIIELARHPTPQAASLAATLIVGVIIKVGIVFLVLAVGDFFLQRLLYRRELRMTKHEVKDEYKETEGNPLHKVARRQFHREILMHSLVMAVKKSDVVVVNPTHYAVALSYESTSMGAPTVVAKGVDFMAAHIRQVATEEDIPIISDVPLAHALHAVEVDDEIPEDLYEAVALVLRWVYQLEAERREVARHA